MDVISAQNMDYVSDDEVEKKVLILNEAGGLDEF